jgi:hypothetical protein
MDKIWSLFSGNSNILKLLLSPVRFKKRLGVRVPLRPPPEKKKSTAERNCPVWGDPIQRWGGPGAQSV